jgi:pimeloyl-ACP methyl ester carboxylesterase
MPNLKANGIHLQYEERGRGEPLVLIMGLGAPGSVWELHAQALEKRFRCFLLDNRGAGGSDKPPGPYSTRMMAEDTAGFMDALGLGQARVAGISMGSCIAQELAIAHPEKVRSLGLVSSWARCDHYTVALLEHFRKMRAVSAPADFAQLLQLWIFTPGHYEMHFKDMQEGQRVAADGYMPLGAFAAQCEACATHDSLDRLGRIQAPALLTVGDADIFTPLRFSEEMHRRMPGSRLEVFRGLGHCHHWEDLERFNDVMTHFFLEH